MSKVDDILQAFQAGELDVDAARTAINQCYFQDVGHTTLDLDRARRTGSAEVIYGEHKTPAQIADAVAALVDHGQDVLVTRADAAEFEAVEKVTTAATFHDVARLIMLKQNPTPPVETRIAVVTAGTSDLPVAEEAALTAEFYGNPVLRVSDVGVAGVHRVMARMEEIRAARVVIVVAGMEGALPSVIGGLVDKPVIAVPTSVGYGASFGGIAALLGMLNTCASGVSVVNIDNGFGAGYLANMINRL
jgi:NCAIR mutase (PurE)-related protein